jgi:hypoxanthine phosphoribosyltransferase
MSSDISEILIDANPEARVRGSVAISADYAGKDLPARRRAEGRRLLHRRPMASWLPSVRDRLMAITSYAPEQTPRGIRILNDLDLNIAGRPRGRGHDRLTLSYHAHLRAAALSQICTLPTKPERREIEVPVRYVGFEIPNKFVIGYGSSPSGTPTCRIWRVAP